MNNPLVSVIMPAYNAGKYISEAIQSVLNQDYPNFELIIINDGSSDDTKSIIRSFDDPRIRYYEQSNKGVSAARNIGLDNMSGDFFCFLDADDLMPTGSITSRLKYFEENNKVTFVDGAITRWNSDITTVIGKWIPSFKGNPLKDLISITGKSFYGLTWMIRRNESSQYLFNKEITHAEDLLFFISLARNKELIYEFTEQEVLHHRIHIESAMHGDLRKLEYSYRYIHILLKGYTDIPAKLSKYYFKKIRTIMFKSFVVKGKIFDAIRVLFWKGTIG